MVVEKIGISMSRPLRDRSARNTNRTLRLPRVAWAAVDSNMMAGKPSFLGQPTTRWRSASICCRGWGAEYREVRRLFSCCHGTLPAPGEWQFARDRRDFERHCGVARRAGLVA